jgi:hypothetical protein
MALDKTAASFLDWSPVQVSKFFAEGDEILIRQFLAAEKENRVIQPGLMDALKIVHAQ